jgi:hypothetical protein
MVDTRWPRRSLLILGGAVAVMLTSIALAQVPPPSSAPPPGPTAPPAKASPLEQTLKWLQDGRTFHASLRDYTCYFIRQERVKGVLLDENVIQFKFRPQPFSVYMRWLEPQKFKGQEVAYIHGKNGNMMRVHPKMWGSVVGFVNIAPTDPRVYEHSRHTIYEAGMGAMIETCLKNFEFERQVGKTQVTVADYTYSDRRCWRVEMVRTVRNAQFYCYRTVLYIDQEHKLPIRLENYDWPRAGGQPAGDLLEKFSYIDIRFNTGLTEADFRR